MLDISDRWWPSFQALYDVFTASLNATTGSPSQAISPLMSLHIKCSHGLYLLITRIMRY